MLKLVGIPLQLLETGVTSILAEIVILLLLVRVKPLILPTPLAAKPMDVLELVH
jgi:hypothetical protein